MTNPCSKETDIALIKQSMETINDKLDKIDAKLEMLEWKFAWKWVEKVLIFIGSIWWSSIIWAIMYLILK